MKRNGTRVVRRPLNRPTGEHRGRTAAAMGKELAATRPQSQPALEQLSPAERELDRARVARENTLCRESMPLSSISIVRRII